MRLTRPNVTRLAIPSGKTEAIVFDDALPGFGVRLRAGGKRVWIAQYRVGTKQRRITLGSLEVLDPDEARRRAKDVFAKVQLGNDPQIEKSELRAQASVTLGTVAERYLAALAKRASPQHHADVARYLKRHWAPLKEHSIRTVARAKIATRLSEMAQENGLFAANRARAALSALFGWAMREGLVDQNPVIGTNKATEERSRDRVLSDSELAEIWAACRDDAYGRIVRLLILTGQRREEVGAIARPEMNVGKALWSIPPARTKNGLPHDVPLAPEALEIIKAVPVREKRDLLFGESEGSFQGWSRAKAALDKRIMEARTKAADGAKPAKLVPWRLHDIRRTVATRMGDIGVLPHVVEAVLNHVSGHRAGVAGIYNRALYVAEKRQALERWAQLVAALVDHETSNIVRLVGRV